MTSSYNTTLTPPPAVQPAPLPPYTQPTATGALAPVNFDPARLQSDAGPQQGAMTYSPTDSALVSSQLTKLISQDSPYVTRARAKAAEYSNARGLINSSIGAGAGEAAAIDAALPIAQADASTNFQSQRDNAAALNTFALDANRFGREGALAALGAQFQADAQARQFGFQAGESAAARAQAADQFGADLALRTRATDLDAAIKQGQLDLQRLAQDLDQRVRTGQLTIEQARVELAKSQQSYDQMRGRAEMAANLQRIYLEARTNLETTPNLDAGAKANAINAMSKWFNESVLAPVRQLYGSPDAWPDVSGTAADYGGVPAPAPPPATGGYSPIPTRAAERPMGNYEWNGWQWVPMDTGGGW